MIVSKERWERKEVTYTFDSEELRLLRKLRCLPNGATRRRPSVTKTEGQWTEFVGRVWDRLNGNRELSAKDFEDARDLAEMLSANLGIQA